MKSDTSRRPVQSIIVYIALSAIMAGGGVCFVSAQEKAGTAISFRAPDFDSSFWETWSDGRAELAGYDLTFPRYGELREGTAVAIFVKEPFSNESRVKADWGRTPKSDTFEVMKLNLVQDFPTGLYDYNMMTSTFVALEPVNDRPQGSPTKVSFSSQEWCGHVYHQVLFDESEIRNSLHSYFGGEADRENVLDYPNRGVSEDVLFHWARGMAAPVLERGESATVQFLPSLEFARLRHQPLRWTEAVLTREAGTQNVEVPAGSFEVEVCTARAKDGLEWRFFVETSEPRRIVKWEANDGRTAEMIASERLKYWQMNDPESIEALSKLGLHPRPRHTP